MNTQAANVKSFVDGPPDRAQPGVTLLLRIGGDFASGIEQLEQLGPVLAAGPM